MFRPLWIESALDGRRRGRFRGGTRAFLSKLVRAERQIEHPDGRNGVARGSIGDFSGDPNSTVHFDFHPDPPETDRIGNIDLAYQIRLLIARDDPELIFGPFGIPINRNRPFLSVVVLRSRCLE